MARFVIIFFLLTKDNVLMLKEVEVELQNGGSASNLWELDTNKLKTKAA